jgi:hypothetical protein
LARELASEIDDNRQQGNLSSAIRLFVLDYFRTTAGIFKSVDAKAGHLTVATTPGPSPGVAGSWSWSNARPACRRLAVNDKLLLAVLQRGFNHPGVSLGPVMTATGKQAHTITIALQAKAVSIVLDLIQPFICRRSGRKVVRASSPSISGT